MKSVKHFLNFTKFVVLALAAAFFLFPIIWMILTSLKSPSEIYHAPLALIPEKVNLIDNLHNVLERAPFGRYYINTLIFTAGLAIVQLFLAIPAAYAFGCMEFKGRDILFFLVLMRFIVTPVSVFLPNYKTIARLNLVDTLPGVMLPYLASAMAVFLLRQSFRQIPKELIDAAKIDGAGNLRFLYYVGLPLIKPAVVAFFIISFVYHWNEFFWPFLVAQTPRARTLSVGLGRFGLQSQSGAEWALTMTAALMVALPVMAAFVVFQRQFVNTFMRSGLK